MVPQAIGIGWVKLLGDLERKKQRAVRRQVGIPNLNLRRLADAKSSDTVFILGSGSSIRHFTSDHFEILRRNDSLGINFWIAHPFVPTYYLFYPGGYSTKMGFDLLPTEIEERDADYARVVKIVTYHHQRNISFLQDLPLSFRSNLWAAERHFTFARSEQELIRALKRLDKKGVFTGPAAIDADLRLFKYGTSLSAAVSMAALLEYQHIVLCGVDLTDSRYFYQDREHYPQLAYFSGTGEVNRESPHQTNVRVSPLMLSVTETLRSLHASVLAPRGIQLSVANSTSALFEDFPLYVEQGWLDPTAPGDGISE